MELLVFIAWVECDTNCKAAAPQRTGAAKHPSYLWVYIIGVEVARAPTNSAVDLPAGPT
jgi:hypothetical protein